MLQSVNGESIANLDFRDVLRIIKIAPRPIRLRFRTKYTQRGFRRAWTFPANELESSSSSRRSGAGTFDSNLRVALAAGSFTLPDRSDPLGDHDDSDSQGAVLSESFGDADSTRTTENSSVATDFTETNQTSARQSSRLAAFLRKPFRRNDGFDGGRWEMRMGIVPTSPRAEIALESPCKAAVHVYWRVHPKALSYHLQYSRDWTMKVWKTWAGRPQRVSESEHELTTTIFGLDYAKSYVVRVRYEFDGSYAPAEWSAPSATVITVGLGQVDAALAPGGLDNMLEGALKSWIIYFLGQYVESQTVNVSAKLWQSSERLKLENLTLKASVIPSWLPFRLKTGFIGLFEADLPISAIFGSTAAKIKFQDVLIVLAPLQHDDAELQDEVAGLVDQKLRHLEQDLLDRWNGPQVPEYTVPHESEGYFGTDGWIGRTMTKLIDNLQIDVRNLHIRVEGTWFPSSPLRTPPTSRSTASSEHTTTPCGCSDGVKFAAGFTLGALSAVTTPSNWRIDGFDERKEPSTPESNHLVFKLINAIDLSAYVDPNALHFIHSRVHPLVLKSTLTRLKDMGARTARADWWNAEESVHAHRFLVAPINVSLKLTMNTAAQHAQTNDPRYDAVFHLSRISMALDEEQLSVLNLVIDSFTGHEKWRVMVAEQVKASERHAASDQAAMAQLAEDYLLLWNQIMAVKKEGLDVLRKSEVWRHATTMEQQLPFEVVVAIRNRLGLEGVTGKTVPFANALHEMGDAMGIPLPEISVPFPEGPTGLLFNVLPCGDVAIKRCADKGPAAMKDSVKPGLLLVKVDGQPLRSVFQFKSGLDVEMAIDSMPSVKVLTFRHPSVKPLEVTPFRAVAQISLNSDCLKFSLVRAYKKRVIAEVMLDHPMVSIKGFGPDLFSYHLYEVCLGDFFVQNMAREEDEGSHCIASSICRPVGDVEEDSPHPALRFAMNYLHDAHPDARPGQVATYGSKLSLAIGNSIVVFDEAKVTTLLSEWHEWVGAISSNYTNGRSSVGVSRVDVGIAAVPPSVGSQLVSSSASTSPSNTVLGDEALPVVDVCSYSHEVKIDLLRFFISAPRGPATPVELPNEPSYRVLLKQLVGDEPTGPPAVPDWARAAHAIVVMQRFIRGAIVRKRKMVRLALARNRWVYYRGDEMMGWLYTRDDSLAFRRWRRSWCHLDEDGNFSFHSNGSGADVLDEFSLLGCKVILLPDVSGGPWGSRTDNPSNILEITTKAGVLRKVLSSDKLIELKKWKHSIENSVRAAARRSPSVEVEEEEFLYNSSGEGENFRREEAENKPYNSSERWDGSALDELLLGGFSNVYRPAAALKEEQASWISLSVTNVVFLVDVHRVSEPEQSGFRLYLGLTHFTALDHRQYSDYGLLHIGDKFLSLKNGKLTPGKMRSDHLNKGPFLALTMSYRGARAAADCFLMKTGANVDLTISGWVMPLSLTQVLFEVIDVLDVLWVDDADSALGGAGGRAVAPGSATTAAWREVSELGIQIRAPVLEAYLEDSHCVAKLTIENSSCLYRADPGMENFKLHLGPTALFVLTDEVALRLVQVDKFWLSYDLRLHRMADSAASGCELCADESAKRPVCHRSVSVSIGQVKLEADRRLELLFALLEALTYSEEADDAEEEDFYSANEEKAMDSERDEMGRSFRTSYDVNLVGRRDLSQTERLQSMQFSFQDQDSLELRPMYTGFGRPFASPSGRSRMSTATSAGLNYGLHENGQERQKRRSRVSAFMPLLNYQSLIAISGEPTDRHTSPKTIFRVRLRVGRIHDSISISCYSVIFEVIKRSLSVVSLDTYIPVMNFSVSDMKLQSVTRTEFLTDYVLDASIEMSARYYNTSLADWEPFIEPWRAYAKARSDGDGAGTSMQLSALQRLNVNCTDSLIRLLSSIAKNRRKQVFYVEKRTLAAVAADGEAKKEDGRVCVLNNLGVPIRLANLNTSHAGTLHVEVRDGWSFPGYSRFHNVRVEVVLLPWWHPREVEALENFRHKFSLPYGGAQSGVTPILRIDVQSTDEGKRNYVFDHVTNKYVEVEADEDDDLVDMTARPMSPPSTEQRMAREDSTSSQRAKWASVGSAEINLAGNVMGSLDPNRMKLNRWYRLHDLRGNVTGEIFVGLTFVPHVRDPAHRSRMNEPQQVKDGQFLVFDPLKTVATKEVKGPTDASKDHVMLSDGLRGSYIPPLALEVLIGSSRMSLMCPLRRAGKFLIQGEKILAEVKVAQRDESRRVLLLSSPVQLKNGTRSGTLPRSGKSMILTTSNKISVPMSAMFGEEKDSIIVKVIGCKPTVVADLNKLAAGSTILTLEAEDGRGLGYCLYVNITSHMRKVYREDHQGMITRGNISHDDELQTYATKYRICLHSCLMFENTLPIRVQYKIVANGLSEEVVRTGTLSPGEEVPIHDFQMDARLMLRLPEMDSIWSRSINLGDCIFRETMDKAIKSMLGATGVWDPIVEFLPSPQSPGIVFKDEDVTSKTVTTRLDYTAADDGSPRIVLFCSLWVYNQSHVQTL
ncbi:hypothetical protein BBJ28_00011932, partial [Nothophytophthora sp. Chile5]